MPFQAIDCDGKGSMENWIVLILNQKLARFQLIVIADAFILFEQIRLFPRRREYNLLRNVEDGDIAQLFNVNQFFKPLGEKYDFGKSVNPFFDEESF